MNDEDFCRALATVGRGGRSFSVLRGAVGDRPLASSEQIADRLTEAIACGTFAPGQPLREQHLAERFSVSRGPIRDALRLLERDGLVTIMINRGAIVTDYSPADMRQINDIAAPLGQLLNVQAMTLASNVALAEMMAAAKRIGDTLHPDNAMEFALALATYTMIQARFAIGKTGEAMFQQLYRPSIRYTITGLGMPNATEMASRIWEAYRVALSQRDGLAGARAALTLLQRLHAPLLFERRADRT